MTKTPKENEKGKRKKREESSLALLQLITRVGDEALDGKPSRENDPKVNACSESGAEDTVYTHEAKVVEENQAGEE